MENNYDIIVIGGGHNGLTAANILSEEGKKVLLLEQNDSLGGMAAGHEFHPGYFSNGLLQDTSCVRPEIIQQLKLENHGLNVRLHRPEILLLSAKGKNILLSHDIDKTAASIAQHSEKDAKAYMDYKLFLSKISGFIENMLKQPPPDIKVMGKKELWEFALMGFDMKRLGNKTMLELLKIAPMSLADLLDEYFETDFLKAGIAYPALCGSYTAPMSAFTTMNLLIYESCSRLNIVGGPQKLTEALIKVAKSAGVKILTGTKAVKIICNNNGEVEGVETENGEMLQTKNVAASCTPHETFFNLTEPHQLSYRLENGIKNYRSRGTTAKVNLALTKPIKFKGLEERIEFVRLCEDLTYMEKAFDAIKYKKFSGQPVLDISIPTVSNPGLAPAGGDVVSILVHYAPFNLEGGWTDEAKERLEKTVMATLSNYTDGLEESTIASEVLTPKDLDEKYRLHNGHIYHGEHAFDQLFSRPVLWCSHHATPIDGLFLCGSGSFPGGGITCAPGALGAKAVLEN